MRTSSLCKVIRKRSKTYESIIFLRYCMKSNMISNHYYEFLYFPLQVLPWWMWDKQPHLFGEPGNAFIRHGEVFGQHSSHEASEERFKVPISLSITPQESHPSSNYCHSGFKNINLMEHQHSFSSVKWKTFSLWHKAERTKVLDNQKH